MYVCIYKYIFGVTRQPLRWSPHFYIRYNVRRSYFAYFHMPTNCRENRGPRPFKSNKRTIEISNQFIIIINIIIIITWSSILPNANGQMRNSLILQQYIYMASVFCVKSFTTTTIQHFQIIYGNCKETNKSFGHALYHMHRVHHDGQYPCHAANKSIQF